MSVPTTAPTHTSTLANTSTRRHPTAPTPEWCVGDTLNGLVDNELEPASASLLSVLERYVASHCGGPDGDTHAYAQTSLQANAETPPFPMPPTAESTASQIASTLTLWTALHSLTATSPSQQATDGHEEGWVIPRGLGTREGIEGVLEEDYWAGLNEGSRWGCADCAAGVTDATLRSALIQALSQAYDSRLQFTSTGLNTQTRLALFPLSRQAREDLAKEVYAIVQSNRFKPNGTVGDMLEGLRIEGELGGLGWPGEVLEEVLEPVLGSR
ncbi:hypothetical protein IAT38_005815 [Cryptococcus sp. DSM 104549]